MALTKAERGLLLLGRSADALNIEVRRGEEGTGNESQFSRSVVGAVFETGEAQILTDIAGDERFNAQQSIVGLQLRTVMCVPLRLSHFGQDIEDDDLEPVPNRREQPGGRRQQDAHPRRCLRRPSIAHQLLQRRGSSGLRVDDRPRGDRHRQTPVSMRRRSRNDGWTRTCRSPAEFSRACCCRISPTCRGPTCTR